MTVAFDTSTGTGRVIASAGRIVMDGFTSNVQAWRWVDAHCQTDQVDADRVARIREAFSTG